MGDGNRRTAWALPVALVGVGLLARWATAQAWTAVTAYATPFAFSTPAARATPPLASRVVLVLVDGLSQDASRSLPFLNELRRRGADLECRAGLPSFSLPARGVILTGAWADVHGQVTNFHPRALPVEHVFQTARREGRATALSAGPHVMTLFAPWVDHKVVHPETPGSRPFEEYASKLRGMAAAGRELLRGPARLVVIELHAPDEAGHDWGGTSAEYGRAARLTDAEVAELAAGLDLARDVLIVASDHGHVAGGGHGGPEEAVVRVPVVLAGGPVRPGSVGRCEQVDVAPTVAVLLGSAIPASSQGRPLLEALSLPAETRREIQRVADDQRAAFGAFHAARVRALAGLDGDGAAVDEASATRAGRAAGRRGRLPQGVLLLIVPAVFFAALWRAGAVSGREIGIAFAAAVVAVLAYHALLPVVGLRYSFTAVNKDEWLDRFFLKDMVLGLVLCAAAAAAVAAREEGRSPCSRTAVARLSWLVAAAFCSLLGIKIGVFHWRFGLWPRWELPDFTWAFGFYLDALVVMAVGFAGPLLPLPAWAAARLVTRGQPARDLQLK